MSEGFKEVHENLHDGFGTVETITRVVRINPFRKSFWKIITLKLYPKAIIGMHRHTKESEIYMTLNSKVTFCDSGKFHFLNICRKGESHSAENNGRKVATIVAIKKC